MSTGKNPKPVVHVPCNWGSWFKYESFGVSNISAEVEKNYVTVYGSQLPMFPFHSSPMSVEDSRPDRLRTCTGDSAGDGAESNNDSTPSWATATIQFAAMDSIAEAIVRLIKKA